MITAVPRVAIAVRDMDAAIERFRHGFGMPVYEFRWLHEALGIRMSLCAPARGTHIELMAPLDPQRAHSQSLIRYLERRGEGLFALMLYAPDPNAEADALAARGIDVLPLLPDAQGRDIHPRSTCGVLIRIYPSGSAPDLEKELTEALGPAIARPSPACLGGITDTIVAVKDLEEAVRIYRDRLGLAVDIQEEAVPGLRIAVCRAAEGARIQLCSPAGEHSIESRRMGEFLSRRGEGLYSLILESEDLEKTRRAFMDAGIPLQASDAEPSSWEIPPGAVFETRIRLRALGRG